MNEQKRKAIEEATSALTRMQDVKAADFVRLELGNDLNFGPAQEHIQRIADLFRQVSKDPASRILNSKAKRHKEYRGRGVEQAGTDPEL